MKLRRRPVRNVELGNLLDTFLVCAVATILVIRLQLWLTNYPQLGGGSLHIAHLLYGGFFMMLAIGLLLSYLSRSSRLAGAVLGGIGFGFFIDELGKFVTADNDYFFKPTAALIYVIFIALFLGARALQSRRDLSPQENLVNAADLVKDAAIRTLDEQRRQRALTMLDRADQRDALVGHLRELFEAAPVQAASEPPALSRVALRARRTYFALIEMGWFRKAVTGLFLVLALSSLVQSITLLFAAEITIRGGDATDLVARFGDEAGRLSVTSWLYLAASVASGLLMIAGALRLKRSRLDAYRMFDRALLVQIFIVQLFALLESQFAAATGLILYLFLFATLRYLLAQEEQEAAQPRVASPAGSQPT